MYRAKVSIGAKELTGTLDMYVIKTTTDRLKEVGLRASIDVLFTEISNLNPDVITILALQSIQRINPITDEDIKNIFMSVKDEDLKKTSRNVIKFIQELVQKCIPKNEESKDEDNNLEDLNINDTEINWDFAFMEYTWKSVLNRNDDFWSITPKNYFEQNNIYKKVNRLESQKEEIEYL